MLGICSLLFAACYLFGDDWPDGRNCRACEREADRSSVGKGGRYAACINTDACHLDQNGDLLVSCDLHFARCRLPSISKP